jgi:hypothetical protein
VHTAWEVVALRLPFGRSDRYFYLGYNLPMAEISQQWNAQDYARNAGFVPALGEPVLELLALAFVRQTVLERHYSISYANKPRVETIWIDARVAGCRIECSAISGAPTCSSVAIRATRCQPSPRSGSAQSARNPAGRPMAAGVAAACDPQPLSTASHSNRRAR